MARLTGKIAVVTGGTRGIGLAVARAFLDAGASVFFTGTGAESVAGASAQLAASGRCQGQVADLSLPDTPAQIIDGAQRAFGRIDILVNNAGILGPADPWEMDAAGWDQVMTVNLRAAFFCAREAAKLMRPQTSGSIINVSSVAAQIGGAVTGPAYVASKAGMIGLTRSLARHFAAFGVRVNCLAPANVETDMTANWPEPMRARLTAMTPLGRFANVGDMTGAALFLASDDSGFVTGQTLNVNGGLYMG